MKQTMQRRVTRYKVTLDVEKYRNPDTRCHYPFEPNPAGYCWGYATAVDKGKKMDGRTCSAHCELWQGNKDMPMPWVDDYERKHTEWWKNGRGKSVD